MLFKKIYIFILKRFIFFLIINYQNHIKNFKKNKIIGTIYIYL